MSLVRSSVQNPGEIHRNVEQDHYNGPQGGGVGYRVGHRTSFETHGAAFTTKQFGFGASLSAQNRSGLVDWDAGSSNTPGFK